MLEARWCEWCGAEIRRKRRSRDARRFCSKKCSGARRTALSQQRRREESEDRKAQWRLRPCLHCLGPMAIDDGRTRIHAACVAERNKAKKRSWNRARYVSSAKHLTRNCFWCERAFITKTAAAQFCGNRCRRRWIRVSKKHGLTRKSSPDIIRGYRFLGDAYFLLQTRRSGRGAGSNL